jgi:hypothetical protein
MTVQAVEQQAQLPARERESMQRPTASEVLDAQSPEAERAEQQLAALGVPLPLQQSQHWCGENADEQRQLVLLVDSDRQPIVGATVAVSGSRLVPGFTIGRVLKFGYNMPADHIAPLLSALVAHARARRMLRLHLELFTPHADERVALANACRALGLRALPSPRNYRRTLLVDLLADDETLLQRFSRVVRKNVRKTERLGHVVAPIADVRFAERLQELGRQTMARTGGTFHPGDWNARIRATATHPEMYHLVGLFLHGRIEPDALVAYRWVGRHTSGYGDDLYAASARLEGELSTVPLMHAVMWDCLRWARDLGAPWFDFGGVVASDAPARAALRSISDFKRLFSEQEVEVGEDWVFEPNPRLARMASAASALFKRVR